MSFAARCTRKMKEEFFIVMFQHAFIWMMEIVRKLRQIKLWL